MNLLKETQKLLRKSKLTQEQIAAGTRLPQRYIGRLKSDLCNDYHIKKVQKVYDFLVKQ